MQYIEMTMEEWENTYKPITNWLDDNASFQNEDGEGIMFETYGAEVEFVKTVNPANIWTYIDGDSNSSLIVSGWHFVNRLGYFVTDVPCPEDTEICVVLDEPNYMCENCESKWYGDAMDLHFEKFADLQKCAGCATMEELKELENTE